MTATPLPDWVESFLRKDSPPTPKPARQPLGDLKDVHRRILALIPDDTPVTQRHLMEILKMGRRSIYEKLCDLERAGLIRRCPVWTDTRIAAFYRISK